MELVKSFAEGEEEKIRAKAYKLCREYLTGTWRKITPSQMVIKKIGGGLSNLLYYCSLPDTLSPIGSEPSRVLLRLYGVSHDEENVLEAHFSECVVFTMLSEKQSGPRLYGIFPRGRLEQYIPGRPLNTDDLLEDGISKMVAEATAEIHAMSVPLSKEPTYLWTTMLRWVTEIESFLSSAVLSDHNRNMVETLLRLNLGAEVRWLQKFCTAAKSPVVFCHNDLNCGNIMLKTGENNEKSIVLIDFEYCSYNHRAYDLANHMCESIYDYRNENFPYFWAKTENFPSKDRQALFVKRYLQKFHRTDTVSEEEISQVIEEIERFILASHLHWTIWSVIMVPTSTLDFDYWGYGADRLSAYIRQKDKLLSKLEPSSETCLHEEKVPIALEDLPTSLIQLSS